MDEKELSFRDAILAVKRRLAESKLVINKLKSKIESEETRAIGLKLAKDDLEECLRRHIASQPLDKEKDWNDAIIDADFLSRLPDLLEKVK